MTCEHEEPYIWALKCHRRKRSARFTLTLKVVSAQKLQNPHSSFSVCSYLWQQKKKFSFWGGKKINSPSLTGFPNGNVHHVQRSHREKRLPLRLGHNEHDAKQVSAQQLDSQTQTDTCSFQYYAPLLLRNSSQERARVFSPVFLSMQMSAQGLSCSNLIRRQHRPENNHMNYRCWRIPPANLQTYSQRRFTL